MTRPFAEPAAVAVVARHLDAVATGTDVRAMAQDYAEDAVLERAGATYTGRPAIQAYFQEVPARLGGGRVAFGAPEPDGDGVVFSWRIDGGPADGTSGRDRCTLADGMITHQVVHLDAEDF